MLDSHALKKIKVRDFTTDCPITANRDDLLSNIILIMEKDNIRHLPIVDGKDLVGLISQRDILKILAKHASRDLKAFEFMTLTPYTVKDDASLDEVAFSMSQHKIGSAVVVDSNLEIVGIFTTTDALNALIDICRGDVETE